MDSYFEPSASYDPTSVAFFDVAHEGAHVRRVAGAMDRLKAVHGFAPRSLIVVGLDDVSLAAAELAVEVHSPLRLPVLVTREVPAFIGALDIVVVVGERDTGIVPSLISADNRGAVVVLSNPLPDAPERALVIDALPTSRGASPARAVALVSALIEVLDDDPQLTAQRYEHVADAIDTELEALSPERDELVNPGRQLKMFSEGAHIVHVGGALAHAAATLWTAYGMPAASISIDDFPRMMDLSPHQDDVFYDPFIDGPRTQIKAVGWGRDVGGFVVEPPATGLGRVADSLVMLTRAYAVTAYQ